MWNYKVAQARTIKATVSDIEDFKQVFSTFLFTQWSSGAWAWAGAPLPLAYGAPNRGASIIHTPRWASGAGKRRRRLQLPVRCSLFWTSCQGSASSGLTATRHPSQAVRFSVHKQSNAWGRKCTRTARAGGRKQLHL